MKIAHEQLAKKYAQAFLRVSLLAVSDDFVAQCAALIEDFKRNKEQFFFIWLSSLVVQAKQEVLFAWVRRHGFQDLLDRLIIILAQAGRLSMFIDVVEQIMLAYREHKGLLEVTCRTAVPLTDEQVAAIHEFLHEKTGKKIILIMVIDSSLLAGIRLQSETFLWEYSIGRQLQALRASC